MDAVCNGTAAQQAMEPSAPASQTAEMAMAHIRERNRLQQQKRRERLRNKEVEVEHAIADVQRRLEGATDRWRQLRQTRHHLLISHPPAELAAASQCTVSTCTPPADPRRVARGLPPNAKQPEASSSESLGQYACHTHGQREQAGGAAAKVEPVNGNLPQGNCAQTQGEGGKHDSQPALEASRRSPDKIHRTLVPVQKFRRPGLWGGTRIRGTQSPPRAHEVILNTDSILQRAGDHWWPADQSVWPNGGAAVVQATMSALEDASHEAGQHIKDIHWSFQYHLYPTSAGPLNFRLWNLGLAEEMLTYSLHTGTMFFEFMFIVREHELLQAAGCPAWQPTGHRYEKPRSMTPPAPPSATVLKQLHVCVGDSGTLPLAQAVEETVGALLRRYRERLPLATWRTVCMHCMYVTEETLSNYGPEHTAADARALEVQTGTGDQPMSLCTMLCASRALAQQTLFVLHTVMHETPERPQEIKGRTLEDVQRRIRSMGGTLSTNFAWVHIAQPFTSRKATLQQLLALGGAVAAQRKIMAIFRMLQLTTDQKEQLACRWRSWCRRRAALSRTFVVALEELQTLLPAPETLCSDLLTLVDRACTLGCAARRASNDSHNIQIHRPLAALASASSGEDELQILAELYGCTPGLSTSNGSAPVDTSPAEPAGVIGSHDVSNDSEGEYEELLRSNYFMTLAASRPFEDSLRSISFSPSSTSWHTSASDGDPQATSSSKPRQSQFGNNGKTQLQEYSEVSTDGPGADPAVFPDHPQNPVRVTATRAVKAEPSARGLSGEPTTQRSVPKTSICPEGPERCKKSNQRRVRFKSPDRVKFLGEGGDVLRRLHEAVEVILDVHKSDELMWLEITPPYPQLTELQNAMMGAAVMEVGHPGPIILHLCKVAARSLSCDELFSPILELPLDITLQVPSGTAPLRTLGDLT